MTLNHSKTWPVSTMAVVQLRVDPHGRTYSTLTGQEAHRDDNHLPFLDPKALAIASDHKLRHEQAEQDLHHSQDSLEDELSKDDTSQKARNGIILPLSKKHLELFTKMSAPPFKNLRTDTVSTILEQDEFDSENQGSTLSTAPCNLIAGGLIENNEIIPENFEKFHVLALSRVEENITRKDGIRNVGRRPSNKVDNWDLIYTESNGNKFSKSCNEDVVTGHVVKTKNTGICNKHNECLLPDIPLDARKATTLRRHYYPEGGWGWVIIVCTVLVHVLNHGIQLSCSQFTMPAAEKFKARPVDVAEIGWKEQQSTINIDSNYAVVMPAETLPPLKFSKEYYVPPCNFLMYNDSHGVSLYPTWVRGGGPSICGGPLKDTYSFDSACFSWGPNDEEGSEHTIDSKMYAMELQATYIQTSYRDVNSKVVLIISYLFQVVPVDNPNLEFITAALRNTEYPSTGGTQLEPVPLSCLMPPFCSKYYTYSDSEVQWMIRPEPLEISSRQMQKIRYPGTECNCRQRQKVINREVCYYD